MLLTSTHECTERVTTLWLVEPFSLAQVFPRNWWVRRKIDPAETVWEHSISAMLLVYWFRQQIEIVGGNVGIIQDTLLIHDLAESYAWVGDETPHDTDYWSVDHRNNEEATIRRILSQNSNLIELWLDYEEGRTLDGRLAMEFDKLQAISQARHYEDTLGIPWLTEEFFTNSVTKKIKYGQISYFSML